MKTMIEQIDAVRRSKAPIVAITTADPAATIRIIRIVHSAEPIAQWNIVDGVTSLTAQAKAAVTQMHTIEGQLMPAAMISSNPVEALRLSTQWLPERSILFFNNAHHYIEQGAGDSHKPVIQAVWNTRDAWIENHRTLILLAPSITMPVELRNSVVVIDEPLPTNVELAPIVARGLSRAMAKRATKKQTAKLVDAVSGLAAFNAEQVVTMSVSPITKRPDMDMVWEQKIKIIEQARGLRIHRHGPTFAEIGGCDNIKSFLTKIANGLLCPALVVFLDEFEKQQQAAGMDTSGTTTDQQKTLLVKMQDNAWDGIMIYGFSGTGKSYLAKAFGNECGCPTIEADLGAMKNMWVGSSEANMRSFIKTIEAMAPGQGRVFFIATCNSVVNLPPEIKRRFRIWFSDFPVKPERDAIWNIHLNKRGMPLTLPRPNDEGWTGAEIDLCCKHAHELGISLTEASKFMTIVSQAMGDDVEKMRLHAHGKYIDVSRPGNYHYVKPEPVKRMSLFDKLKGE